MCSTRKYIKIRNRDIINRPSPVYVLVHMEKEKVPCTQNDSLSDCVSSSPPTPFSKIHRKHTAKRCFSFFGRAPKEKARSVVTLPPVCFHFLPKHVVLIACCRQTLRKKTIFINFQHWILIKRDDWVSKRKKCKNFPASELKIFTVVLSNFLNVAPRISLIQNLPLGSFDNGIKGSVLFRAFDDCCKVFSWFSHGRKKREEIKRKIIQFLVEFKITSGKFF